MKLSINVNYLCKKRDDQSFRTAKESIRILTEAGFEVLDYTPDIRRDDWEREVDSVMNAAACYGAVIEQSHAPYNFYAREPREVFLRLLERSARAAVCMGIRNLVYHADEYHPQSGALFDPVSAREQIYEILSPSIEIARKGGVCAALETVFEDVTGAPRAGKRMHYCADVEELISIIDRFGDSGVGCCWDFGHAKIACGNDDQRHVQAIGRMGKRILCTHIHDNYYNKDIHVPPFMGEADWSLLMPALMKTGYRGSFTFEMVYGTLPDAAVIPYVTMLHGIGERLQHLALAQEA